MSNTQLVDKIGDVLLDIEKIKTMVDDLAFDYFSKDENNQDRAMYIVYEYGHARVLSTIVADYVLKAFEDLSKIKGEVAEVNV